MRSGTAHRGRRGAATAVHRPPVSPPLVLAATALLLGACSGGDDEAAADPAGSGSSESSGSSEISPSPVTSSSPITGSEPAAPEEPRFRPSRAGKEAFVSYIIEGWGHALRTNDPSVLLDASGAKPCRGCDTLRAELRQRDEDGWYVQFPGAEVRSVKLRSDGPVEVATAVVDIPESQSFFDDGTFRNDNEASTRVPFVLDIKAVGRGEKRQWTLLAFSIR